MHRPKRSQVGAARLFARGEITRIDGCTSAIGIGIENWSLCSCSLNWICSALRQMGRSPHIHLDTSSRRSFAPGGNERAAMGTVVHSSKRGVECQLFQHNTWISGEFGRTTWNGGDLDPSLYSVRFVFFIRSSCTSMMISCSQQLSFWQLNAATP